MSPGRPEASSAVLRIEKQTENCGWQAVLNWTAFFMTKRVASMVLAALFS
jgi:hypothetical protein